MKKILVLSAWLLLLAGCRGETEPVLSVSESNAQLMANLEIAEEKLEDSRQAYDDALTSLETKREAAYSAGFYDGCISLYLMMDEDEFVSVEEADSDKADEDIKNICFAAQSISERFWQDLFEDGSYFGLPANE